MRTNHYYPNVSVQLDIINCTFHENFAADLYHVVVLNILADNAPVFTIKLFDCNFTHN